jgi:imidazolonepropionase-like amidohydrolase
MGIWNTHGTMATGKAADLVVLNRDTLADLNNLDRVYLVIKDGQLFKKRR